MARYRHIIFSKTICMTKFLHEVANIKNLFAIVADEQRVLPLIVEKDYWLMHCLWGLQQQGYQFELKGGTSLSKGFALIDRFSEDIDIQLYPESSDVKIGKNHDKVSHINSRRQFFDSLVSQLSMPGLSFKRDHSFDDNDKMRSAGIRAEYQSLFSSVPDIKEGILLELGFDQTTPNIPCTVSSWVYEKIISLGLTVIDNRAKAVPCYCPEYTFVEKLQAISTKYRMQKQNNQMPINFLRHYYDIYRLLETKRVLDFIGTDAYHQHKQQRFRQADEVTIKNNPAFSIPDMETREQYSKAFKQKSAMYFKGQPSFKDILLRLEEYMEVL